MTKIIFLHNTRCSKSREALEILSKTGKWFELREYLKWPLDFHDLEELQKKLWLPAIEFTRANEVEFKQAWLTKNSSNVEILKAISKHPKLLQRPILISENKAIIGRPPEKILELL